MALLVMAMAAAHVAEECVAELRGALLSEHDSCSRVLYEALAAGRIGPFLLLAALTISAVLVDGFWLAVALGVVAADLLKHVVCSLRAGTYSDGLATAIACFAYLGWLVADSGGLTEASDWGAIVIGGAFVTIHQLSLVLVPERRVAHARPARP